ncbi:MAG: protein kinase [Acidobacteria bacterium]|nr:protein kinase [Acidobacteriota bacterium]
MEGRFRIESFLGAGGMGEVYAATDLQLNTVVALKTVRADQAGDDKGWSRLRREVLLARQVTHPNVCRIYDFFETTHAGEPLSFLTMEKLDGETLSEYLRERGPMTAAEAMPVVEQLASALEAAHAAGVVHRDFKSGNVMLVPKSGGGFRCVVTDFGLSHQNGAMAVHSTDAAAGTPAYMAPEQMQSGEAGPAADVYSLGVVMYQMVTGKLPLVAPTPLALGLLKLEGKVQAPSTYRPGLPRVWDVVTLRCLRPDPRERFASAREVARALAGEVEVKPAPADRRQRAYWWAAAVVISVASVLIVVIPREYRPNAKAAERLSQGVRALHSDAPFLASRLLRLAVEADPNWAIAHGRLAQAYWELDLTDQARQEMLLMGRLVQQRRLVKREALLVEALQSLGVRDFSDAAGKFRGLADVVSGEEAAAAMLDHGRALAAGDRNKEAAAVFERLTAQAPGNAGAWLQRGMQCALLPDYACATAAFDKAEAVYKEDSNQEGVIRVLLRRSALLQLQKKLEDSKTEVRRAMDIATADKNVAQRLQALSRLSMLASLQGKGEEARGYSKEVVQTALQQGMPGTAVSALNDMGTASLSQKDYAGAESHFRQAVELAERNAVRRSGALANVGLATCLIRTNRVEEGLAVARQAREFLTSGNYRNDLIAVLRLTADAEFQQGDNDGLARDSREYLKQAEASGNALHISQAHQRVNMSLLAAGDFPGALAKQEFLREHFFRESGREAELMLSYMNSGYYHLTMGDAEAAERLIAQAEKIAGTLNRNTAAVAWRLTEQRALQASVRGQVGAALALVSKAMEHAKGMPESLAFLESRRGELLRQAGRTQEAVVSAERALAYFTDRGSSAAQAEARCRGAAAFLSGGQASKALQVSEDATAFARKKGQAATAAYCALVRWGAARALGGDEGEARREFEQVFQGASRTWSEQQRSMFRQRSDCRWLFSNQVRRVSK